MLPPVGQDGLVVTDAKGRRMRIRVEYLDEKVSAPTVSLPVLPPAPAPIPILTGPTEGSKPVFIPAPVKTLYDHPRIGGRFTLFVLLYGDFFDMHRRCLSAVAKTTPADRVEVRVGSNELGRRSLDLVHSMIREGRISHHYHHRENRRKYPVMREMFWDPERPIATDWLIWFDDDTFCDRNPDWLALLSHQIVNHPGCDMFGPHRFYRLSEGQPAWIREAPWYRGKPFRDKSGKEVPNGDCVHFASGSLICLRTAAMREADIPCKRLGHNGGDWTIGEQLHQAGFKLKGWCNARAEVEWSAVPRRGLSEVHPGTKGRKH